MNFDVSEDQRFEPLVSIVIPVYNGSNYLKEAIDSALAQTYKNIEIIVVNDGSRDDGATESIALSYGSQIRYIHKPNGGVSSALNEGLRQMKGEYFSWLSHDDAYYPDKVEEQIKILSELKDKKTILKCETEFMDKYSHPISKRFSRNTSVFGRVLPWDEALIKFFAGSGYNGCALLIHREVFDVCGFFDESLHFNQDGFMWIKIFLNRFSVYHSAHIGVRSRIHEDQVTRKRADLFYKDSYAMSEYVIPQLLERTTKTRRFILSYGKYNARYKNKMVVKEVLKRANIRQLSVSERLCIRGYLIYGRFRSSLRNVYYRMFRGIRINGG